MAFTNPIIDELYEQLTRSHWPKCNEVAEAIANQGGDEAKQALVMALKVKRHHVRSASIKALASMGDPAIAEHLMPLLADPAYEARIAAKEAIISLTGQEVTTAKGE